MTLPTGVSSIRLPLSAPCVESEVIPAIKTTKPRLNNAKATGRTNHTQEEDGDGTTLGSYVFLALPSAIFQVILRMIESDKKSLDENEHDVKSDIGLIGFNPSQSWASEDNSFKRSLHTKFFRLQKLNSLIMRDIVVDILIARDTKM